MKDKIKKSKKVNTTIKLNDVEVVKAARKICIDIPLNLGDYVTEAVKEKNKKFLP